MNPYGIAQIIVIEGVIHVNVLIWIEYEECIFFQSSCLYSLFLYACVYRMLEHEYCLLI